MKKGRAVGTYLILVTAVLLVKILGMVRTMLLSRYYGATALADAFNAASSLPLSFYDITLGTAIASAFVPVFNDKLANGERTDADRFASNFLNCTLLIAGIFAAFGMLYPQVALHLVASGLEGEAFAYATSLTRIIMPVIALATGTYVFIGVLQSYGEFTGPALVSLCYNAVMILYFLVLDRWFGIYGLGVAFTIGWLLQLLFLVPYLKKKKFHYSFGLDLRSSDLRKVLVLTLPLFVAALAQPINQLISSNISSGLGEGMLSSVNYAYQAYFIVSGIFSYCLTNLFFPEMSRCFARGEQERAKEICGNMIGSISAIILPIMAFLGGNSKAVVRLLYEGDHFSAQDTRRVGILLAIYTVAMLFYSYQDILNKYFYSMQKVKYPVLTAFAGIAVNLAVALVAVKKLGVYGLALGTVCAAIVMAGMLLFFAGKVTKGIYTRGIFYGVLKDLVGAMALFIAARELRIYLEQMIGGAVGTLVGLIAGLVVGLLLYGGVLWLLGSKELHSLIQAVKKNEK